MIELTKDDDFKTINDWLEKYLVSEKSFIPCKEELINLKSKDDSKSKGIYFWFMRSEGYVTLRNFAPIQAIEPKYTRIIDNIEYDLIYLGTTGTGKQGKNNFFGRLNWHITQVHRESTIRQKESALSTLRTGLGSLLADDLIIPNTEIIINDFMKIYMKVFWIEYPDNKKLINENEEILIKNIKPLLNLTHNPNRLIKAKNNPTKEYRKRRNLIEKATKKRLGYPLTKNNMNSISENKINSNQETLNLSKNFKIIMMCNSGKRINSDLKFPIDSELNYLNHKIKFSATSNHPIHQFKPDDLIPNQIKSWRNYIEENQYVDYIPYMSYQLYIPRYAEYVILYEILFERFKENLYILSAGWGLVNATYRLPEYDITFSNSKNNYNQRKYKDNSFYDYNQLNLESDEDIVFIGSDSYIKSFLNLTIGTRNRKIIYHYGNQPDYILPDNTFIYREYNTENYNTIPKRTWYLELAYKFADGLIP